MVYNKVLLDTHILLWILTESDSLKKVEWFKRPLHWIISPISLLEIKFLQECGKIKLEFDGLIAHLNEDIRFEIDNPSIEELCFKAFSITWTRDPFDRLLVAHSIVRAMPFGTLDKVILKKHSVLL